MKILLLIPAFNEEPTIAGLVRDAKNYLSDILVVDDGSRDGTRPAAIAAGAMVRGFNQNQGKGEALKLGFEYALDHGYGYVITMDGDGQHDPRDIANFLAILNRYDLLLGNRMEHRSRMPLVRRIANLAASFIVSVLSGCHIYDSQTGFRSYSADLLGHVNLSSSRYELETEVVIKAARRGLRIGHCGIKTIYADEVSRFRSVTDSIRFLRVAAKSFLQR